MSRHIDPERLSSLRQRLGLSQAQLAERAKIAPRTIERLETGSNPKGYGTRPGTVVALAKALGVKPEDLIVDDPIRTPVDEERERFGDYFDYLYNEVGRVKLVSLGKRVDQPDLDLVDLFVNPELSEQAISCDLPVKEWPARQAFGPELLAAPGSGLVVLGSPGSGKSTLAAHIACQLADEQPNEWRQALGDAIPLLLVLRELKITEDTDTWEKLLDSSPLMRVVAGESVEAVKQAVELGRAVVIFDGVDEVGSIAKRQGVRAATRDLRRRYPNNRVVITSRVVGYDEVPQHVSPKKQLIRGGYIGLTSRRREFEGLSRLTESIAPVPVRYLAPFDDLHIFDFAHHWHLERETPPLQAEKAAQDLCDAIHKDDATLRLARTPNLLTLMALIHRVDGIIPKSRLLLYDRITEAYLETIDVYRFGAGRDTLEEKKKWLGEVALQRQMQRDKEARHRDKDSAGEILIDRQWLFETLTPVMAESGKGKEEDVAAFIDFVQRRSGLFLEKGSGQFAFLHLTFLEYFSATRLLALVQDALVAIADTGISNGPEADNPERAFIDNLRRWTAQRVWHETLIFFFQASAAQKAARRHQVICRCFFGRDWEQGKPLQTTEKSGQRELAEEASVELLVRLALDDYSGFDSPSTAANQPSLRDAAIGSAFAWLAQEWRQNRRQEDTCSTDVWDLLWGNRHQYSQGSNRISQLVAEAEGLSFWGILIGDVAALTDFRDLKWLDLSGTEINDLSPLSNLTQLQSLDVQWNTGVTDLSSLSRLTQLQSLVLGGTGVNDLSPLTWLTQLQSLDLTDTRVTDLSPLRNHTQLQSLDLMYTGVMDLAPLSKLTQLQSLNLWGTGVTDLAPLSKLTQLQSLNLTGTGVTDLAPLSKLTQLQSLNVSSTSVTDLSPLSKVTQLQSLDLRDTGVTDLAPLSNLTQLQSLQLWLTRVTDLAPLSKLTQLQSLDLRCTGATDLAPLSKLTQLQLLDLEGTGVRPSALAALRAALPNCKIEAPSADK